MGSLKGSPISLEAELLPPDIFKNTSPSLYQFIVATCFGTQHLTNYDLSSAQHVRFEGLEYPWSTDHLKTYFKSWDFLENYPVPKEREGLVCKKTDWGFGLFHFQKDELVSEFKLQEECFSAWSSAAEGMVCSNLQGSYSKLYDVKLGKVVEESNFIASVHEWCKEVPSRSYDDKICYLDKEYRFSVYDLKSRTNRIESFSSKEVCYRYIWKKTNSAAVSLLDRKASVRPEVE